MHRLATYKWRTANGKSIITAVNVKGLKYVYRHIPYIDMYIKKYRYRFQGTYYFSFIIRKIIYII